MNNHSVTVFVSLFLKTLIICCFISGCGGSASSGFSSLEKKAALLPEGIPESVIIAPFTGDVRLTRFTAEIFRSRLGNLGFNPVKSGLPELTQILPEYPVVESFDSTMRVLLADKFGAEGIFTGHISGSATTRRVRSELELELIDILSNEVLWSVKVKDAKMISWSKDLRKSSKRAVENAIIILKEDLKKHRKLLAKQAKAESKAAATE